MATALEIFNLTMALADEQDSNGNGDNADTTEYKNRTIPILNTLINEVYPYSDTYQAYVEGKRPTLMPITEWDEYIDLDDAICYSALPYGLGSVLYADENPTLANFFRSIYESWLIRLRSGAGMASVSEDIEDVYGGSATGINGMSSNPWTRW